jgi:hypothetical protein
VPELPLLVVVDDVFVLVHAADPVEAAAAKVADVRPDLVVRVTDVKLLLGNILLLEIASDYGKRQVFELCETGFCFIERILKQIKNFGNRIFFFLRVFLLFSLPN